ncbi:ParB/RepB/Spo0J family partition protein [Candidatus Saccharibacteria bacterium]|nr:ParB/RepB/Spo0J family partition protein [Candidatus Saccharibacteria bacterium]
MAKQKGLGRGFGSLLPEDFDTSLLIDKKDRTQKLFISDISPNPEQPRKHFDKDALSELASSIKRHGILQPLVVTPDNGGKYIIIAGERRYRAAKSAGIDQLPVLVRTSEELDRLEIGLVENVQRVDLSPLEQAVSIAKLHEQFSMGYDEIAKRLGKANTTIANIVRLLQLPDNAKDALTRGDISEGHARSILALKDHPDQQTRLLELIEEDKWSVRQAEKFVNDVKNKKSKESRKVARTNPEDIKTTEKISKKLDSKVAIIRSNRGGRVQIFFNSEKELKRISKLITD